MLALVVPAGLLLRVARPAELAEVEVDPAGVPVPLLIPQALEAAQPATESCEKEKDLIEIAAFDKK